MVVPTRDRYSQKEITSYAIRRINDYVAEHEDEILRCMDEGEDDKDPEVPSFEDFYFNQLAPEIREKTAQSGYTKKGVEERITHFYVHFYYVVAPNVCINHQLRLYHDRDAQKVA